MARIEVNSLQSTFKQPFGSQFQSVTRMPVQQILFPGNLARELGVLLILESSLILTCDQCHCAATVFAVQ